MGANLRPRNIAMSAVLEVIEENPGITFPEICGALPDMDRTVARSAVMRLHSQGYIVRGYRSKRYTWRARRWVRGRILSSRPSARPTGR